MTGRGIFNTVSEDVDPRASMLFSQKFLDDTFGVLASVAFQKRNIREVGYSAVDILSANTNANNLGTNANPILLPYCTPIGWTQTAPSPTPGSRGATADNCSTGNPRTSDPTAFQTVYDLRRARCAQRSRQRRVLAAPAALREFRAGHRAHRRHAVAAMDAERKHQHLDRWPAVAVSGRTPRQLHPRPVVRPQSHQQRPADGVGPRHLVRRERFGANRRVRRRRRALRRPGGSIRLHVRAGEPRRSSTAFPTTSR